MSAATGGRWDEFTVPVGCIERCVALPDCAMFNPTRLQADFNERVAECSIGVVQRPLEALEQETAEMVLYPAEVGVPNITKVARA